MDEEKLEKIIDIVYNVFFTLFGLFLLACIYTDYCIFYK